MRITVVTAMWGRPHVTSIMLRNLMELRAALAPAIDLRTIVVGSEGEWSLWLARAFGADYVCHVNKPLSDKWGIGVLAAKQHDPDAVVILGSDNVVNKTFFQVWAANLRSGIEYQGLLDSFQYHPVHHQLVWWHGYTDDQKAKRTGEPCGSGRCWSRELLKRLKWRPWDPGMNRGLDWCTTQKLKDIQHTSAFRRMGICGVKHLGIKTKGTMSPFVASSMPKENLRDPAEIVTWFGDIGTQVLELRNWYRSSGA